jgi:ribokinase
LPSVQKRITVVGSLNADLVVRAPHAPLAGETVVGIDFARHAGGKGANQAAAAARLCGDDGIGVFLIGRVGQDAEGVALCAALAAAGIDLSGVGRDDHLGTGIAAITVAGNGENRIVLVPGANQGLTPGILGQHHDVLTSADVLLLQLEIPLPTVQTAARMGREKRAVVILDPAPARPLPAALLRLCDYVTPNETELGLLVGTARAPGGGADAPPLSLEDAALGAEHLLAQGARNVVVKLGAQGALLVTPRGRHLWPAFATQVVDTTAAGDAWNGAFAVALAAGQEVLAAGRFACAAAALAVSRAGALPSLPTRPEVEALLAAHP